MASIVSSGEIAVEGASTSGADKDEIGDAQSAADAASMAAAAHMASLVKLGAGGEGGGDEADIEGQRQEEVKTYAGLKPEVFKKLRPAGQAIAKVLDEAINPPEEEEPVYYWDDDFDGNPDEMTEKQKLWHNLHWAGYNTVKGMEFTGEIFANFYGL